MVTFRIWAAAAVACAAILLVRPAHAAGHDDPSVVVTYSVADLVIPIGAPASGAKTTTGMGQYVADGGLYSFPDRMTLVLRVEPPSANSEARIIALQEELAKVIPGA